MSRTLVSVLVAMSTAVAGRYRREPLIRLRKARLSQRRMCRRQFVTKRTLQPVELCRMEESSINPFAGDKKVAATGEQMFSSMNCDGCHGGGATGFAAPSLADGRWRYGGADDELFQTIYFGRPKGMPAFGGLMSPDDVWTVVTYLKSLPEPEDAPTNHGSENSLLPHAQ